MPIAKMETSQPAVEVLTPKRAAIWGINPMKPISVFKIPKTPIVKMSIINLLFFTMYPLQNFYNKSVKGISSYNKYLIVIIRYA